jgi:hypothetical protein
MAERGEAPSERAADVAGANNSNIHLCSFSQIIVGDEWGKRNGSGHKEETIRRFRRLRGFRKRNQWPHNLNSHEHYHEKDEAGRARLIASRINDSR